MNTDPLAQRLSTLPDHQRRIAVTQLARAEAIVDALATVVSGVRQAWVAVSAPLTRRIRAYTRERTRLWPHAQA